ncbi:nucleotidyltransferase domain-containing protein [Paenibacillus wenxiniae]|uniref:Nucleotidyltransferase domain-containing protein n=1 Tax=Paenibacillus wenxiniae TaxID=1636843 RepID=A0ABW4RIW9_9BACL
MKEIDWIMQQRMMDNIRDIETREDVRVLYVCEAGSRAWGGDAPGSDYDVRFIYVHRPEWYLSIFTRRDVIEQPIDAGLDLNGWDIVKALNLFRRSNPSLLEWLNSDIVYEEWNQWSTTLREWSEQAFSPRVCMHHYLSMAKSNFRSYLQGQQVRIKKYMYVLRPLLACSWIHEQHTFPPLSMETLIEQQIQDQALKDEVNRLLQRKRSGDLIGVEASLPRVRQFIDEMIDQMERCAAEMPASTGIADHQLDELFRATLRSVWAAPINETYKTNDTYRKEDYLL